MKVTKVRTKDLIPVQERMGLCKKTIENYYLNGWEELPLVININNNYVIMDGHHRAAASGEYIEILELTPREIRGTIDYFCPGCFSKFTKKTSINGDSFLKELKKSDFKNIHQIIKLIPLIE